MHREVSLRFREIALISKCGLFAVSFRRSVADHGDATLRLDMRIVLVMRNQTDTRVVQDIFGVFGEGADEYQQAGVVIHQIGCNRAERIAVKFFRQGAEHTIAMGAQHLSRFVCGSHGHLMLKVLVQFAPDACRAPSTVSSRLR